MKKKTKSEKFKISVPLEMMEELEKQIKLKGLTNKFQLIDSDDEHQEAHMHVVSVPEKGAYSMYVVKTKRLCCQENYATGFVLSQARMMADHMDRLVSSGQSESYEDFSAFN